MRNELTPLRPGLTAIAAVLALSATPVFAQNAETAPAQDVPVISAPAAAPAVDTASAAMQQSVTTENASAPVEAPTASMATQSPVVIHQPDSAAGAAPAAKAAAPKHVAAPVTRSAAAMPVAPTPVAKLAEPAPAPVAAAPAPAAPAPIVKNSTTSATSTTRDDNRELEIAGAGTVGLIVLIGGAVALSRRRRDDEESVVPVAATTRPIDPATPVAYQTIDTTPVKVAPIAAESAVLAGAPTTELHKEFDLSRYGRHVQLAYRGPTEDNPSLSLRHRLKRARFMDQRARENGETFGAVEPAVATARTPASQNLIGTRLKDGLRSLRPQGGMRPAFG